MDTIQTSYLDLILIRPPSHMASFWLRYARRRKGRGMGGEKEGGGGGRERGSRRVGR